MSSWEAAACCAWAGGRLPREEEWIAAALGPHGFQYPWGNNWEDGICNTKEAGLGVTSPVGLFPRARHTELGIEDLFGNLWEWCGSLYHATKINDRNELVMHGGSWADEAYLALSYFRRDAVPDRREEDFGFRVVCSSHTDEHCSLKWGSPKGQRRQQSQPC